MAEDTIVEDEAGWSIPVMRGLGVTQIVLDYQFTLRAGSHQVVIEQPFRLRRGGESTTVTPSTQENVSTAVPLLHEVIGGISASRSGVLTLTFANGAEVQVEPSPDYEAWNVCVHGRLGLVATPGGEVAVWPRRS